MADISSSSVMSNSRIRLRFTIKTNNTLSVMRQRPRWEATWSPIDFPRVSAEIGVEDAAHRNVVADHQEKEGESPRPIRLRSRPFQNRSENPIWYHKGGLQTIVDSYLIGRCRTRIPPTMGANKYRSHHV